MQIHGTSLKNALNICQSIKKQEVRQLYTFDTSWKEAESGALAFATADGKRHGNIKNLDYLSIYAKENVDFPKGVKGLLIKTILRQIAHSAWEHNHSFKDEFEKEPCVIMFKDHPKQIQVNRKAGIREICLSLKENTPEIDTVYVSEKYKNYFVDLPVNIKSLEDLVEQFIEPKRKLKI